MKQVKKRDQEEFLEKTKIENLKHNLDMKGLYEFTTYQVEENGSIQAVRYRFRYFDAERDVILCTREYMQRFADSDDVTELLNTRGFQREVRAMMREPDSKGKYSLLLFDIKGFKAWNELLGYTNANEILKIAADEITSSGLHPVVGGRSNGDHFWFLVHTKDLNVNEIGRLCNHKINVNGNAITLRMHCGIYNIDNPMQEVAVMCDKAAIAETQITNEFATPWFAYDSSVEEAYMNQIFVLNNLDRAFEHNEFKVFYQPIYDVKTRTIVSAEALVRWQQVGGKLVSPGIFIPVLEEKGYISKLDLFIEKSVQAFLENREKIGRRYVPVSMNLSRMDFMNDDFMTDLNANVEATSLAREYLRFEVTESAYISISKDGGSLLDTLRNAGSKIYIDDFGTGYSSLQNLMEIEFDVLKLDMIFIRKIGHNQMSEEIIRSAITISHNLDKRVIAEGVETEEQYRFLLEAGCDYIQGYYFSKPLPEKEFAELLDRE